jgi:hypothetical protein
VRAYPASGSVRSQQRSLRPKEPAGKCEFIFARFLSEKKGDNAIQVTREQPSSRVSNDSYRYKAHKSKRRIKIFAKSQNANALVAIFLRLRPPTLFPPRHNTSCSVPPTTQPGHYIARGVPMNRDWPRRVPTSKKSSRRHFVPSRLRV